MSTGLPGDLTELELAVLSAAGTAAAALDAALPLIGGWPVGAARTVLDADDRAAAGYLEIEERVELLLARRTPVASDLRRVLAALHVARHLERVAHNAARIARLGAPSEPIADHAGLMRYTAEMGERALAAVRQAEALLAGGDLAIAEGIVELDALIDRDNAVIVDLLLDGAAKGDRPWQIRVLFAARCLERVGDHAVNVAERVAWAREGDRRRLDRIVLHS